MAKQFRKYTHFTMRYPEFLNDLIRKECYEMGCSKQEFLRQITRSHLSKKYGKDVFLDLNEIKEQNKNKL
jgi:hypothetical protein